MTILAWSQPTGGSPATSYMVLYRVGGSGQFAVMADPVLSTTYSVSGLIVGISYDFAVIAKNSAGPGPLNIVTTSYSSMLSLMSGGSLQLDDGSDFFLLIA